MLALALLGLTLGGCGAQIPGWLPANITEAREAHKPLVLLFYATWCTDCRRFRANVLTDPRVAAALTRVKFVEYNGATKAGLDAFSQGLGDALVGTGVRVVVVRPGFVHTSMTAGMDPAPFSTTPDAVADAIVTGLQKGHEIIWAPGILRVVFSVMRHLPRPVWRRVSAR